jgi:NitT/TauT family transport system substrate-binding protein
MSVDEHSEEFGRTQTGDPGSWRETIKDIGQVHGDITVAEVIENDYVADIVAFDKAKVKADADSYKLPGDYASIDVEAVRKAL